MKGPDLAKLIAHLFYASKRICLSKKRVEGSMTSRVEISNQPILQTSDIKNN